VRRSAICYRVTVSVCVFVCVCMCMRMRTSWLVSFQRCRSSAAASCLFLIDVRFWYSNSNTIRTIGMFSRSSFSARRRAPRFARTYEHDSLYLYSSHVLPCVFPSSAGTSAQLSSGKRCPNSLTNWTLRMKFESVKHRCRCHKSVR
jgi:hypothetical protein